VIPHASISIALLLDKLAQNLYPVRKRLNVLIHATREGRIFRPFRAYRGMIEHLPGASPVRDDWLRWHTQRWSKTSLSQANCRWGPRKGVVRYPLDQLMIQPGRFSRELPVWSGNNHMFIQKLFILAGSRSVKSLTFSTVGLPVRTWTRGSSWKSFLETCFLKKLIDFRLFVYLTGVSTI
jgi:hypothetical protein